MSFNKDKFKEVMYEMPCSCTPPGVGGTNPVTDADGTRDVDNPPEDAVNKNRDEIDEMVDSGEIQRHEPDFLEFITGKIGQTATSDYVSNFMGKPSPVGVKQVREGSEMKDLIEKYILKLNEEEKEKDEKEELKEESKDDNKEEEKEEEGEEEKEEEGEEEKEEEKEDTKESKEDELKEDSEEEVVEENEINIDDIPDELIAECLRAADHDVSLVAELTENVLDNLDKMVEEGATLDIHEMTEDLIPITSEEEYDYLVDAYTLSLITGDDEYLEEACLNLQNKEEERLKEAEKTEKEEASNKIQTSIMELHKILLDRRSKKEKKLSEFKTKS